MKKIKTYCLVISIGFLFCLNMTSKAQDWIKFDWSGFNSGDRYFKYGSISIPFKFDRLSYKFYAQFDLGILSTIQLDIMNAFSNNFVILPYELKKSTLHNNSYNVLCNVGFVLDNIDFKMDKFIYNPKKNIDWKHVDKPLRIGSIGADICTDKILILDFPNQRLALVNKLPTDYLDKVDFINCDINYENKVIFPLKIGDKVQNVLLDTGASSWEIVTKKSNWIKISDQRLIDSITISSFGEIHYMIGSDLIPDIYMGSIKLSNESSKSYYATRKDLDRIYDELEIYGILGNRFFLNDVLIIDYIHNKIGLLKQNGL